jgi:hypothetical protein
MMQVWICVSGNTEWMASGNPFKASMMAIRMSFTQRFLIPLITRCEFSWKMSFFGSMQVHTGAHRVQINWKSDDGTSLLTRLPRVDLEVPSSNIGTVVRIPGDRWVLYAGGSGIGPVISYWGELIVFFLLAVLLGRMRRAPLRSYEWLTLGLGLSTFSCRRYCYLQPGFLPCVGVRKLPWSS